jgi:hypothetical protein
MKNDYLERQKQAQRNKMNADPNLKPKAALLIGGDEVDPPSPQRPKQEAKHNKVHCYLIEFSLLVHSSQM